MGKKNSQQKNKKTTGHLHNNKKNKHQQDNSDDDDFSFNNKRMKKNKSLQKRNKRRAKLSLSEKDVISFNEQLNPLGLFIHEVDGDGNCLFRAIADQLVQDEHKHSQYREICVDYMRNNSHNFAPFVVDEDFAEYCDRMEEEGEWGGNLELVALSWAHGVNIVVYQLDAPKFEILNHITPRSILHLSYHMGEHYNSVRARNEKILEIHNNQTNSTSELTKKFHIIMQSVLPVVGRESAFAKQCDDNYIRTVLHRTNDDVDSAIDCILTDYELSNKTGRKNDNEGDGFEEMILDVREFVGDQMPDHIILQTLQNNHFNIDFTVQQLLNQQEYRKMGEKEEVTLTKKEKKRLKQKEKMKEHARKIMEESGRKYSSKKVQEEDEIDDEEVKKLISSASSIRI